MSNQIESSEELRDWKTYRKILKQEIDAFAGSGPVFVTKEKFEFDVNGRPWRSQAVLLGEKGKRTAQLLRKQGVVFKEGTAERRAEGLVVSGVGAKAARGAIATFGKLALGVDLTSAEPLDDDEDGVESNPAVDTPTPAPPPGAGAPGVAAPGGARAKTEDENVRLKHEDVFLLTMAIDDLHRHVVSAGPDDFVRPQSGKAKLDTLGSLLHAIAVDPKFAGKRAPMWKKAGATARNFFAAVKKRAAAPDVAQLFDQQVAQASRQLDEVFKALERADALVELDATVAEGKRTIKAEERERADEADRERREKLRGEIGGGDDGIRFVYQEARIDPELFGVVDQTNALTKKQLGREPSSTEDQLIWIDNLERVKKVARAAISKAASAVRSRVHEVQARWDTYVEVNRGSAVAAISEIFGGALPMRGRDFERAAIICANAIELASAGKVRSAADALASAIDAHQSLLLQWQAFDADTVRGAGVAVVTLEIVKEASFTIVSTYTGGAAAVALKAGAIGSVFIAAVANVAGSTVKSGATYVGHVFAGTTEQFDVTEEFYSAIKSGASSVAGGAVSTFAKAKLAKRMMEPLGKVLESKLGAGTGKFAGKILDKVIYDMPDAFMGRVVEGAIDQARGKSFGSSDEFLDFLAEEFARGGAAQLFTTAFSGKRFKDQDAIIEALAAGISG